MSHKVSCSIVYTKSCSLPMERFILKSLLRVPALLHLVPLGRWCQGSKYMTELSQINGIVDANSVSSRVIFEFAVSTLLYPNYVMQSICHRAVVLYTRQFEPGNRIY